MEKRLLLNLLFVLIINSALKAQYSQAYNFVLMPHSVSSFGSGEQGVASLTPDDAFVYNPAKLSFTNNTRLSFFRNPVQLVSNFSFPLTNVSYSQYIPNIGYFGLSFENWSWGEMQMSFSNNPDGDGKLYESYERSFSLGFARKLTDNFNAGIQLRYAYNYMGEVVANNLLLSLGVLYNPELCNKGVTLGFSLMNLGTAVEFERPGNIGLVEGLSNFYDPPPTRLNLGINYIAAENDFFSLPLDLSISKPFDERNDDGRGQSSFKTLFSDWSDFPKNASLHMGLSFKWKPLELGGDLSYVQEFFIGNSSGGSKTNLTNFYTLGANVGLSYKGFLFSMGYAGYAHNVHYDRYLPWKMPYQTFQFALELNNDLFFSSNTSEEKHSPLDKIIFSFGLGETVRLGKAKSDAAGFSLYNAENNLNYSAEAAFYFNKNNALVSSLSYNSIPYTLSYAGIKYSESKIETFSFFSSYRYHPFNSAEDLFIQSGLGIFRLNPVLHNTSPRYDYKTAFQLAAGFNVDVLSPVIFTPLIDYNLILMRATGSAPRIAGYNQFNFVIKAGYSF